MTLIGSPWSYFNSSSFLHNKCVSTKLWWCVHMGITPPCDQVSDTNSLFYSVDRGRNGIWHAILCCIWDDGCSLACNEGLIHGVQCKYLSLTIYIWYANSNVSVWFTWSLWNYSGFYNCNFICSRWMYLELEYQVWGLHTLVEWSCWGSNLKVPLFQRRLCWKQLGLKLKESWCWKMFSMCKISQHIICCAL